MQQTQRFKENTGFCLLCREWKLLVVDGQQTNHGYKKSSYCIRCSERLRHASARMRLAADSNPSHSYPGHEDRISFHQKRVHIEQCLIKGLPVALEGEAA